MGRTLPHPIVEVEHAEEGLVVVVTDNQVSVPRIAVESEEALRHARRHLS